jgi:hypothetical protein
MALISRIPRDLYASITNSVFASKLLVWNHEKDSEVTVRAVVSERVSKRDRPQKISSFEPFGVTSSPTSGSHFSRKLRLNVQSMPDR